MTDNQYLVYYGTSEKLMPLPQLEKTWTWSHSLPEGNRRVVAMMDAAIKAGVKGVGVGEAARSFKTQYDAFFARHTQVATGGCCVYQGKRYMLKSGVLHAAPPGQSVHEDELFDGYSAAWDLRGWENHWMDANCTRFGLKNFGGKIGPNVNDEEHHFQLIEFANNRSDIIKQINAGLKVMKFPLPGEAPAPDPVPVPPTTGTPPPPILKEDLMITVFQPVDCHAEFIGMTDVNNNALEIEWVQTPEDQRRRDAHIQAGARIDRGAATNGRFKNCTLTTQVPVGDSYLWTAADFHKVRP